MVRRLKKLGVLTVVAVLLKKIYESIVLPGMNRTYCAMGGVGGGLLYTEERCS